jgi:hypothetical protein
MTLLAKTLLLVSLPGSVFAPSPRTPVSSQSSASTVQKHGKWYLAETGHAVYCYGPVMLVRQPEGNLQRVATYCKGDRMMVPLKD